MMLQKVIAAVVLLCALAGRARPAAGGELGHLGRFAKWAKIEIVLPGPASRGTGKPNPFGLLVDVAFTSPSGRQATVPGFYDGDGKGGLDGNAWKVRFSADEVGDWTFVSRSAHKPLDGCAGTFTVTPVPEDARGFRKWGRLEAVGRPENGIRYLKFRDGPYWLKAGCDDPENFLGRCRNYDTPEKRKAAVDYLASKSINSLYLMTHNIGGDGNDVWPWLGKTAAEAKTHAGADARFDIAKLEEWRDLFEHMQARGVVPYLVLEDDSAWAKYDHARYYREMIARFGYLPALLFNFNEEHNENYRLPAALAFMKRLQTIDPYGHPRGIHNVNSPTNEYIDAPQVDFTAIQTKGGDPLAHNKLAIEWIRRCKARRRRVLMVGFDEGRPEQNRRAWWAAYLGGGVWEAHVRPPYDRPMSTWDAVWTQLGGTRAFMETLPFWEMEPSNALVEARKAFCLAKPGQTYALYLPEGGEVAIELPSGAEYDVAWWNPANGRTGRFQGEACVTGGPQRFAAPGKGDWALRVTKRG